MGGGNYLKKLYSCVCRACPVLETGSDIKVLLMTFLGAVIGLVTKVVSPICLDREKINP
jgi:hypothetical protein